MTSMDLNLLPSSAKFQAKKIQLRKRIGELSVGLLIIWVLSIMMVFAWWYIGKMALEKEADANSRVSKEFAALAQEIVVGQDLKTKAKLVGEVLDKRFEYSRAFEQVSGMFPEEIILKDFDLEDKTNIGLTGISYSSEGMDKLELLIEEINRGENEDFSKASIEKVVLNGSYWEFTIKVELK